MAQRGKRVNRNDNDLASYPGAIKRRKCRLGPAAAGSSALAASMGPSEEEETMASSNQGGASWTARSVSDIKIPSIYNRSSAEAPAELFRKDLISAMKLPDSEPLSPNEYWVITDQWKQEWERGVQVPVNPDSLPEPMVTVTQTSPLKLQTEFKLPKKFIRISRDDYFNSEDHHLSTTPARAEKACAYDLDDTDIAWLEVFNGERAQAGQLSVTESQLERVIEELEVRCWERIQTIVKNEEGLGIEYDENVICDVCRSPDSEEGNEMVFCDCCNICVHQACYGITSIPDGSWLCRTCSLSQRPDCVLCPNKGGAMKSTRSGQKWAHVSCALWIPEVSIGCVEKMEPITKISSIPQSRWALICVLCRERVGACIQCSIKTCKTAYHVTCAFKYGLEMKAIIEDEMADDGVKLRSYCQKHSRTNTKDKVGVGGSGGTGGGKGGSDSEDGESRRRKRKDMTSEEKNQARAAKLQEIEAEFDKHVSIKDITSQQLDIDPDSIVYIYNYWKLKRRAGHNKPLLAPRCGELSSAGARAQGQAADVEKMRTFVQLRQDLERVRNLCYMVGRREKLCRTFLRLREQTFHKQVSLLSTGPALSSVAATAVIEANHGPSIYDRLYSHPDAEDHTHDFDTIIAHIAGIESPTPASSEEKKVQPDFNGASNKKFYFNGSVKRKSLYGSDLSSMSSSETDATKPVNKANKCTNKFKSLKIDSESSTEDEENTTSKSKTIARRKSKKSNASDRSRGVKLRDSSESDKLDTLNSRSRTLQLEKELGSSGSESDELLPLSTNAGTRLGPSVASAIYSDTDSDSQEHHSHSAVLITKAAVKEFSAADISKNAQKNFTCKEATRTQDYQDESTKNKENVKGTKKKEYIPSALIVPQRQAAKKASEIMQRTQGKKENNTSETIEFVKSPGEPLKPVKEKSLGKKQRDTNKTPKDIKNNDVYDFDKEVGDGTEILAYVPQRQAAKKAAEHIKSGMGTKTAQSELEVADVRPKKELLDSSKKKEGRKEESPKKEEVLRKEESPSKDRRGKKQASTESSKSVSSALTSNSESSSSSSSCSSSSESSSDSDVAKSPTQKISSVVKEPVSSLTTTSSTTTTTSSESDTGNQVKNKTVNKRQMINKITDETVECEKKTLTGRKLKKLPDKKLKTSDGRHGPEFQPPLTEREESGRTTILKEPQQSQQQQQQQQIQQQQQSSNKKADRRDASKKSASLQSQHSTTTTEQSVLGGPRDNDGLRGVSGAKSTKKSNQLAKQTQQQSVSKGKEDCSGGGATFRAKSETRKRKSNEINAKDDKSNKETTSFKKVEKKLTEKIKESEKDSNKHDTISSKNVSELSESSKITENIPKMDDKKSKRTSNRNAINTLEEEMKQRRAERDSPKKSSRGLDKLLEKREHLDKLSRNKTATQEYKIDRCVHNEENKDKVAEKSITKETINNEDVKNHMNEEVAVIDSIKETETVKKDIEIMSEKSIDRRKKTEYKIENEMQAAIDVIAIATEENVTKQFDDNICTRSLSDKVMAVSSETVPEKEYPQKRKKTVNRSIFSPQHGSKDPSVSELFDFDQDILNDDIVNDDGFSIPRDEERGTAPLSFSFNNELWFKEDSKEDSARETLHLVEKLRMELSKKSNSSQFELESVPTEEESSKKESPLQSAEKGEQQQSQQQPLLQEKMDILGQQLLEQQSIVQPVEIKNSSSSEPVQVSEDLTCKNHMENKRKPCYPSNTNNETHYMYENEERETAKVTVVERAKLDRADADERWVPPSMDNFNSNDVQHLNTLIDNQNHRYAAAHQFSNDIGAVMPDPTTNSDAALVAHLQLNMNMQDQYLLQQTHSIERVQQHLEAAQHAAEQSRVQSLAMMDQQVAVAATGGITTQIDEMTPIDIVNRHLIGIPNSEDDQGSEMDRVLDKEDVSSDMRQDYTQSGSPYNELNGRPDTRWAESQVLPSRRSTSSSITSASSAEEHAAIPPYKNVPPIPSYPPCTMDATSYHSYSETSSYGAGAVSLFPPQSCAAALPYPSPGTAMFPPFGTPFPTPQSLLPHVPKPLEESLNMQASPCTAAFTSSSHNMALTAAMVSPTKVPTPPPAPAPLPAPPPPPPSVPPVSQQQQQSQQVAPTQPSPAESPSAGHAASLLTPQVNSPAVPTTFLDTIAETQVSNESVVANITEVLTADNKSAPSGKKSPSKPTRTSARVTSLQSKSPGKSPRQETTKTVSNRGRGRINKSSHQHSGYRGNRGRNRGRGRGKNQVALTTNMLHNDDSIQNKLVGTVYDFDSDEDSANETNIADLRTMRERKKSTDVNEKTRANETLGGMANDSGIQSLSSPMLHAKKYIDDKKLASPAANHDHQAALTKSETSANQAFVDNAVMPLLPGPVDMRTYNSTVDQPNSSVHGQSYGNHLLGSFAAGVSADPNLPDIDDLETELLRGNCVLKKIGKQQLASAGFEEPCTKSGFGDSVIDPSSVSSFDANKVSLTDSRNQLKVKIKGPFVDANYVPASSVPPLAQQAPVIITPTATSASVASGTSNLRRMRKKELLRQYCSQDMNMDDPTYGNVASAPIIPPINPNRTVITIPKAVASMTSIPTREDYKAVVDANMEKKRRKERGGGSGGGGSSNSNNAGFLDIRTVEEETGSDRRRNLVVGAVNDRRRGRQTRPSATTVANSAGPPKLKIKIGNSIIGGQEVGGNVQDDRSRIRPPKKRLSNIPSTPSIEELRRESMKFRKMIMAGFNNDEKTDEKKTRSKRDKNGKRKKRQSNKQKGSVQILEDGVAPKLIIRLGKVGVNSSSMNDASNDVPVLVGSAATVASTGTISNITAAVSVTTDKNNHLQALSDNKDNRVGPPPPDPIKEEVVYPIEDNVGEKQPTDLNAGATALRNVRSAKVTPIRLKLTRCQEGYELKDPLIASSASVDHDDNGGNCSGNGNGSDATMMLVNSIVTPTSGTEQEKLMATAERLRSADTDVAIAAAVAVTETGSQHDEQLPSMDKQSSKEDDIALLPQSANHSSSGCPPTPLPQGCQVR